MWSFFCFLSSWIVTKSNDEFNENMFLRPLEDGSLFVELRFDVITKHKDLDNLFYELFPKSIGELFIRLPSLWQFDLTLTRGRWKYQDWGSFRSNIASQGAELRAVFYDNIDNLYISHNHNAEWLIFEQILSGLYCASINELNIQIVNNTKYHFVPSELEWLNSISNSNWLYYYGQLPKENICTENLTPFSKLLPCRLHKGLSQFLNPSTLFSAKYQSMQVHVTPLIHTNDEELMKMTQSFELVLDMNHVKQTNIKKVFDTKHLSFISGCPVADSSLITFMNMKAKDMKPSPHIINDDDNSLIYSLHDHDAIKNIKFQWRSISEANMYTKDDYYLKTERYVISDNLISAHLVIRIMNQHPTDSIRFSYFEALPHFLKLYFHSMHIAIDGEGMDPFDDLEYFCIEFAKYKSDVVRIRNENPVCMEFVVSLKANSELIFTMDIEKRFEHFESYPPDYNRGFDVGNGLITVLDEEDHTVHTMHTPQLLILLPYPDMSMVFNVIAFSSTLFAFFFGTAFNNMYRDIEDLDKRNVHLIRDKLKALFSKVRVWIKKLCGRKTS